MLALAKRIASRLGQKVFVLERHNLIACNVYYHYRGQEDLVHKYGPHIFHTKCKMASDHLSRSTEWWAYYHRVRALVRGKEIPLPFSLASSRALFYARVADKLEKKLTTHCVYGVRRPILKLKEIKDPDILFPVNCVFLNEFESYSAKAAGPTPGGTLSYGNRPGAHLSKLRHPRLPGHLPVYAVGGLQGYVPTPFGA